MGTANQQPIVLFHYPGSLWAVKIRAYFALRGIPYHECIQPDVMPRPDLAALNIHYRRIPVLAIGRDIYFDTVLMLEKLEQLIPGNTLGARDPTQQALEKMLEKWVENAVIESVVGSLPSTFMENEQMVKDRRQFWVTDISIEGQEKRRPQSLANMRTHFNILEKLLSDDRHWVLSTDNPGLADIHVAFALDWIFGIPEALPERFVSDEFPKTFDYLKRYNRAIATANNQCLKLESLAGADAAKLITESDFVEPEGDVEHDPTFLQKRQKVALSRSDESDSSRSVNRDLGTLLALTPQEVVIATEVTSTTPEIRLHAPRWGFAVESVA
ncbi:hypothetical protein ASPFODRAFT_188967 [Aspergillus luchuensis CBS 106.47]|uniref:GST C-terminal domain-containing protein n=1 Tax=Aspergillus luchuensis (strain CBS 106.47) TaxID=1137211 RepID=A0A1M3TJQ1_ASPLC|nr:hypothetical protein ASPFODRAFT_188967 [Aspergillus luchuensis CBS 106.47]